MNTEKKELTDNELIAQFDGLVHEDATGKWCIGIKPWPLTNFLSRWSPDELEYHKKYDWLMPVWFKFKNIYFPNDLDANIKHTKLCQKIAYRIANHDIIQAWKQLVIGIKWYNSQPKS